jgi:hypothetical protein
METNESRRIAAALAIQASEGASTVQIANAICGAWQQIDSVLSPIIGAQGVSALFRRSLHVSLRAYPWLAGAVENSELGPLNVHALEAVLLQQRSADAATGGGALLQTFYELLGSMIGPALCEQLLGSIGTGSPTGPSPRDTLQ